MLNSNIMNGTENRFVNKAEAENYLDKLKLSPITRSLDFVIENQKEQLNKYRKNVESVSDVQIVLMSDFQGVNLLKFKVKADSLATYFPLQFKPQSIKNISIDSVWMSNPNIRLGNTNELNIKLSNYGNTDAINSEIGLSIGNMKKNLYVDIPKNGSIETTFTYNENAELGNEIFDPVL